MSQLKVFSKLLKKNNNLVILITRTCDDTIISYNALRKGNLMVSPLLEVVQSSLQNVNEQKEVHPVLYDTFYKVISHKQRTKGTYDCKIAAMPDRKFTLRLKRSGKTCAEMRIAGQDAVLICVHMDVNFEGIIPEIRSFKLIGVSKSSKTQVIENIDVTDAMRGQFNVTKLIKAYAVS